jgi:hypothetical protein
VNDDASRQRVVVTDIKMPFGSMIAFMVKWAIASIPAVIILMVLGALFWSVGLAAISSVSGIGKGRESSSSIMPDSPTALSSEQTAYLDKVLVKGVSVGQSTLGEKGAYGEVKNIGERTLKRVEITIFCLDKDGKAVFEKTFRPVRASSTFGDDKPLKPGYSRSFGVKLDDAPSDWANKVDVKVTMVEFE